MSTPVCANMDVIEVISESINGSLPFVSITDLKLIISIYLRHEIGTLRASEAWAHPDFLRIAQDDLKPAFEAFEHPKEMIRDLARTTGQHLLDKLSWDDVQAIMTKLAEKTVAVSGVRYPGRYVYVLAVWTGHEDQHAEHNSIYPPVTFKHIVSAVKALLKELKDYI